jgi:hypothetical protein
MMKLVRSGGGGDGGGGGGRDVFEAEKVEMEEVAKGGRDVYTTLELLYKV